MFCSFCGKNLNPGTKFCSYCGKAQPVSQEAAIPETAVNPVVRVVEAPVQPVNAPRPAPAVEPPAPAVEAPAPAVEAPAPAAKSTKPAKKTGRALLFGLIGVVLGAVILAAVFFFTGMISFGAKSNEPDVAKIEGPGYDTPEEAAEAYLTALRDQDVDAMVSTFAVESYVENFDLEAWCERLQCYAPNFEMKFPNSNEYNADLNLATRQAYVINQIANQYLIYNVLSVEPGMTMTIYDNPALVSEIENDTDNYVFSDLEITGTMSPDDITNDIYSAEKNQENLIFQNKAFGVDDLKDVSNVVITFDADGESWYFCPQLIRYEGRWYVQYLAGNAAAIMGINTQAGGIIKENWEDEQSS